MTSNFQPGQLQTPLTATAIELHGVQVRYTKAGPPVLDIDALSIRQGERVAVIGPSGAAKTTLLRLINGYVQPEAGRLTVLGRELDPSVAGRRRTGFVFQDFNLIERATVFQNVLWGRLGRISTWRSLLGLFPEVDKQRAMQAIAEVDLVEQANQRADTLSGGQQQRVAVARVLAQEAKIILADEPVSNLDPALADDILGLLSDVARRHGVTLLMSVHQPALAQRYAERIIGLRQGRLVFDGKSRELSNSALRTIYGRDINHSFESVAPDRDQTLRFPGPADVPAQPEPEVKR